MSIQPNQTGHELLQAAIDVLHKNDSGNFTIPAHGLYNHQWLWDSCFTAIGQRHYDVERAKIEIMSILRGQWSNGMVPNMILDPQHGRDGNGNAWQSWLSPLSPDDVSTSGITQPPMLADAVVQIGQKLMLPERRSWYKSVFPALIAHHEWLYHERDPHHEGLALQIHPWETGLDNTPPWMHELHEHLLPWWIRLMKQAHLDMVVGWFRTDTRYVPANQRLSNIEALALYDTQRRLKRKNYDINKILDHSLFTIEDLSFNAIFIRANTRLREIAKTLRQDLPAELVENMSRTEKTLEELWDPYTEQYYSRDFVTHRLIKEPSIASLLPLYAGSISTERAKILVRSLENEHIFGPAFPVPSAPVNSAWFDPIRYWQGPTWLNTNWLIIDGLKRYGFHEHAAALKESSLEMVTESGFYEYFNPLDGSGLGAENFSWTAALTIDFLHQK